MTVVFLATGPGGLVRMELSGEVERVADGSDVRSLAADPADPTLVFAGTQGHGVLRSEDGGRSWAESGLQGRIVKSLVVSRCEPNVVFAGTKPTGLFVSRDRGRGWEELRAFRKIRGRRLWFSPAEAPFKAYVLGLAVAAQDPDLLLAGIEAGAVVRSVDGGRTWQGHRQGAMRDCHQLLAHPQVDGWFYEGGNGGGAVSSDGGQTWTRPNGLDRKYGWAVAADCEDPSCWYVSVSPGVRAHSNHADAAIFRSRGGDWQRLGGGLPDPMNHMPYALVAGPEAGQLLAGLASGELWETTDYGESWRKLPAQLPYVERSLIRLII